MIPYNKDNFLRLFYVHIDQSYDSYKMIWLNGYNINWHLKGRRFCISF